MNPAPPGGPARPDEDAAPVLSAGQYDSFVVRVFSGRAGDPLHGQVTHVATRRTERFTDLHRVVPFILATIGQRRAAGTAADGTVHPD